MSNEPERPAWSLDGSTGPLPGWKNRFPDHALERHPNILSVFEKGITVNSKGQTCVLDQAHGYFHKLRLLPDRSKETSFAEPYMGMSDTDKAQAIVLFNAETLQAYQLARAQHQLAVVNAQAAAASASSAAQQVPPQTPSSAPAPASASGAQSPSAPAAATPPRRS